MRFSTILALVFASASAAAPAFAYYAEYDARDVSDALYARDAAIFDARDVEDLLARAYLGRNSEVRHSGTKYGYGAAPPKRDLELYARGEHATGDGSSGHRGPRGGTHGKPRPSRD